ncbi:uncharacterized protein LOC143912523 [Arctopsyche grandis]|uniref:uncharacterized protein LOC143912523 n=1 Tax=Arctopsyche grandis TaxID=121162 RepID=UPI00406D96B7
MSRSTGWDGVNSIKRSICGGAESDISDQDISCDSSDDDVTPSKHFAHKCTAKFPNLQNLNQSSCTKQHNHRRNRPTKKRKTAKAKLNFSNVDKNVTVIRDRNKASNEESHTPNSSPLFFTDDESNKPIINTCKGSPVDETTHNQDEVVKNDEEISSPILKVKRSKRIKKRLKHEKSVQKSPEILTKPNTNDEIFIGTYSSSQNASVPSKEIDDAYISSFKVSPDKASGQSLIEINESSTANEITFTNTNKSVHVDSAKKKSKKKLPVDSLASRLQKLIKKQESFLSIWKHERYMASHGDFECPAESTEETLTLNVVSCREECGIFMIECSQNIADDTLAKRYIVIFNSHFVKEVTVGCGWTLIIYKPYKIFNVDNTDGTSLHNIIVNVCKFDVSQC